MENNTNKKGEYSIEQLEAIYKLMGTISKKERTSYFICYFEEVRQRIELLKNQKG